MSRSIKILAVSPEIPKPDTASGDRRFCALLEILAREHSVSLFSLTQGACGNDEEGKYFSLCEAIGVRGQLGHVSGLIDLLSRRRFDAGLCEFWRTSHDVCSLFRWLQPWAAVIVDSVDVHFLREETALALGIGDSQTVAANREKELAAYRTADAVVVVTEEDRDALERSGFVGLCFQIPNILPIRARPSVSRARELLFVGGFKHAPNADGLLWFVREIWPAIKREVPEASLTVVGSHPPPEVLSLSEVDGIEVKGYVSETAPYLDRAAVSVAPLRYGGGMKGKVCEALASGLPVVTTSFGAQGLQAISGEHLIIADDAENFGQGVVGLLRDASRSERLGRSGQSLLAGLCSPRAVSKKSAEMTAWIESRPRKLLPLARWGARSFYHRLARSADMTTRASWGVSSQG